MSNPYYLIAQIVRANTKKIWFIAILSFMVCVIFGVIGLVFDGARFEDGASIFGVLGIVSGLPIFLAFLIPLSKTFTRLESEKGVYRNHKVQEWFYTLIYSSFILVFLVIVIAFFLDLSGVI